MRRVLFNIFALNHNKQYVTKFVNLCKNKTLKINKIKKIIPIDAYCYSNNLLLYFYTLNVNHMGLFVYLQNKDMSLFTYETNICLFFFFSIIVIYFFVWCAHVYNYFRLYISTIYTLIQTSLIQYNIE